MRVLQVVVYVMVIVVGGLYLSDHIQSYNFFGHTVVVAH